MRIANVMFYPVPNVMWGVEYQYGSRDELQGRLGL